MKTNYLHHLTNARIQIGIVLLLFILSIKSSVLLAQTCPLLPGGVTDLEMSTPQQFAYPGNLPDFPLSPSAQTAATAGEISLAAAHQSETPSLLTIAPTLNGVDFGAVVLQFYPAASRLTLTGGAELRIYEGNGTGGTLVETITAANQASFRGTGIVIEGITTIEYVGASNANLRFRYYTGDQHFVTVIGRPAAIWNDFIQPNSYAIVDDTFFSTSSFTPVITAFFDEDKNYVNSVSSFCLDAYADIPTLYNIGGNQRAYPGQISYALTSFDDYDLGGASGHDAEDQLIGARILWLIEQSKTANESDLDDIQYAIWKLQGVPIGDNIWYDDALAAVPSLPTPPEPDPFELSLAENEDGVAVEGNAINVVLEFPVGAPFEELKLNIPAGVEVTDVSGGVFDPIESILTIQASLVELEFTAPNSGSFAIQAVYENPDYYNVKNLNIYTSCDPGYQPFLHVGEKNLIRPFRSIELEWTEVPLPVTLVHFDVTAESNNVNLSWRTAFETDFSHFEVEKSLNAKTWNSLARVNGNNSGFYTATDSDFRSALAYYRLKMIDLDGSFSYSPIERISSANIRGDFAYPNPAANRLFFSNSEGQRVQIYNASGREVINSMSSTRGIDVSQLHSGMYVATIRLENGTTLTQRFIKL